MTDKQKNDDKPFPEADSKRPGEEEIIKAYIQYSEESRYRDRLMHNSYYLILIIIALFAGHLINLELKKNPLYLNQSLWITILIGGIVAGGIGAIMATYNRKRINAEDQRQVLENVLDVYYTTTGLLEKYDDGDFGARFKDNPFAMQETVIHQRRYWIERLFIEHIPIALIATIAFVVGVLLIAFSALMVLFLRFNIVT